MTGRQLLTIRIVDGGSQNRLLYQLRANACGRRVVAGPAEETVLGNILVQAVALEHMTDIAAARGALARSVELVIFEPRRSADWYAAYAGFNALIAVSDEP